LAVNINTFSHAITAAFALGVALLVNRVTAETLDATAVEFFESKIRPLLVDHCYKCHSQGSEKGVKGGLYLDTREGLLRGGDSGPALKPGDPDASLIIKAVRYLDEALQMPPKDQKLQPGQITDLEAWVRMGAPDPRSSNPGTAPATVPADKASRHWAFQPVRKPALPQVANPAWPRTPVDHFILAKLEQKKLSPSPQADKRTLLRRAAFDLTGLPPTSDELAQFLADESPDAYAKAVDRLLASPRFGERWARHWLDVARYADTKGYVFEEERRYPFSYTYRDYVIRALNDDLPFNQFLIEQIAADHLPMGEDKQALAALGYLTLGRRFLNNQTDIIDDRIDVVTRGMMGLTVACARCHDHKYDPIPAKDYYSLYGVFASSSEPSDKPLLSKNITPPGYDEYVEERKKRSEELEEFRTAKEAEAMVAVRQSSGDYLWTALEIQRLEDKSKSEGLARQRKLHPATAQRWVRFLDSTRAQPESFFSLWHQFAALPEKEFEAGAEELTHRLVTGALTNSVNPHLLLVFSGAAPKSMKDVADRYGKVLAEVDKRWRETIETQEKRSKTGKVQPLAAFADAQLENIRQVLYGADSPTHLGDGEIMRLFDVPAAQKVRALRRKLEELDAVHPGAPPRAMVLTDNRTPHQPRVFVRGNPSNPGPEVPRQFLEVLAGPDRKPFKKGSGRLELAEAIASPDNPLTARVFVNRVWMHCFGAGLVRTPSDFGLRSDPPTHPELLDYLAATFVKEGWSVKRLLRTLVLSSTYQQSSDLDPAAVEADPNNQWLSRMVRRRLDLEAFRDTLLAVGGEIDFKPGGHAVDITTAPFPKRRTVYGFIERQNLPAMFRTFDFASPDTTSPQRFSTTVPQQALFMLNSPFVVEQAKHFAQRSGVAGDDFAGRVRELYQAAFQRDPSREEVRAAQRYFDAQKGLPVLEPELSPWTQGYGAYDAETKRVNGFEPLPHFTGQSWQGGRKLPDAKLGWVTLTATGGHPGDQNHAAIRRWIAPMDATVIISGRLGHDSEKGDGVRARVVAARIGEAGSWTAKNQRVNTDVEKIEVKQGEVIDFVVDCREGLDSDAFTWAPAIKVIRTSAISSSGASVEWNAKLDFAGPQKPFEPLTPWEKYAQVLLMSNELAFVD
jgi:hypothetical protein